MLCRVRIWTDEEWDAMPLASRPPISEYVAGLGWVAAIPEEWMN
jgi:hypothetical protein